MLHWRANDPPGADGVETVSARKRSGRPRLRREALAALVLIKKDRPLVLALTAEKSDHPWSQEEHPAMNINGIDIETLDRRGLLDLLTELEADANNIKGQIADAQQERRRTGQFADPEWFRKANTALRILNNNKQRLQRRVGMLGELEREKNRILNGSKFRDKHQQFLHAFFRAAKRELPEATLDAVVKVAHDACDRGDPSATECSQCSDR